MLEEVGIVDAVLARETADGLELIDGHLRTDVAGEQTIPVLVLDLDESEADIVLATFDPLTEMAKADRSQLAELLTEIDAPNLADVLGNIAKSNDLGALVDPKSVADSLGEIRATYQVLVTCKDEQGQLDLLSRMETEGYDCRALIT